MLCGGSPVFAGGCRGLAVGVGNGQGQVFELGDEGAEAAVVIEPVVAGVAVIGDRVLRLLFSDGTAGDVDFFAESWTGVLEPLNDPAYFARVTVDAEAGTIAWPDGIDLAPEPLYEQARAHPLITA